jgi:hypothetical protein
LSAREGWVETSRPGRRSRSGSDADAAGFRVMVLPASFDTAGARAYLGNVYTESALVKRRQRGLGPPFRRDETGRILYLRKDLDEFLAALPRGGS